MNTTPPSHKTVAQQPRSTVCQLSVILCVLSINLMAFATPQTKPRVIVLGFDGMDYSITKDLIDAGQLPNFAAIAKQGTFAPLQTSMPPLSPVAWSNFMTGMNPGGHGIFDFLRRDPAQVKAGYLPQDAVSTITSSGKPWPLPFTPYVIPASTQQSVLRHGPTLWQCLEKQGVDCMVYKMPANFPTAPCSSQTLSGMGTPDIEGSYGMFTFLTTDPTWWDKSVKGGRILNASVDDGVVTITHDKKEGQSPYLRGPTNPFKRSATTADVPFSCYIDSSEQTAVVIIEDTPVMIKEGEWSPWIRIRFELVPAIQSIEGMVRFYLQATTPHLRLYASPVHLAPGTAGLATGGFDLELQQALGNYHTKGMPQATKALTQGVFSDEEYLEQSQWVLSEKIAALNYMLKRRDNDFLFFYVAATDLDSHVLWHHRDNAHPRHTVTGQTHYGKSIDDLYAQMDDLVGLARQYLKTNDHLYIISDHGFTTLRRVFNLTSWLAQKGHLNYKAKIPPEERTYFYGIDWSRTRAYPVGFNGLCLNLKGREASGWITPQAYDKWVERLKSELLEVRDNGNPVFSNVYEPHEIYSGDQLKNAPDLILGYTPPYGPSDDGVLGTYHPQLICDQLKGFSGHHSVDYIAVPGILFSSQPLSSTTSRLEDVTVTILKDFGVAPGKQMTGRPLY